MDFMKHPARGPLSALLLTNFVFLLALGEAAVISHSDHVPLPIFADSLEKDASSAYAFDYSVSDAHTGDAKSQWETQLGGIVRGQYALLGPDGNLRSVSYTADDANGFQAVVRYTDPRQPLADEDLDEGPDPATHSSDWESQNVEQQPPPLPSDLGVLRPGYGQYIGLAHDGASSMYRYQPPLYDSGYRLQSTFLLPKQNSHGFQAHQLQNQQEGVFPGDIQPPPWTAATGGVPGQTPWRTWTWSQQPRWNANAHTNRPITPKPIIPVDISYVYFGQTNLRTTTSSPTPRTETQCQKEWRPVSGQYTTPNLKYHTKGDKIYVGKGRGRDRTSTRGGTGETSPPSGSTAPGSGSYHRVPGNLLYSEAPAALYIPFPGGIHDNGGTTTTTTPTGTKTPTVFADPAGDLGGAISPLHFVTTSPTLIRGGSTPSSYEDIPAFNHPTTPSDADAILNAISELARAPTREPIRTEPESPELIDLQRVPIELIRIPTEEPERELGPVESTLLRPLDSVPQSELELERVPIEIAKIPTLEPQIVPTREPERAREPGIATTPKPKTGKRKTNLKNSNVNGDENSITPGVSTEKPPRKSNSKKRASANTKRGKTTTSAPPTKNPPSLNKSINRKGSSQKNKVASKRNGGSSSKNKSKKNASNHTVGITSPGAPMPDVQMNVETTNSVVHVQNLEFVDPVSKLESADFTNQSMNFISQEPHSPHPNVQETHTSISPIQETYTSIPIVQIETTTPRQYVNTTDFSEPSLETQNFFQNDHIDRTISDYTENPLVNVNNLEASPIGKTTSSPVSTIRTETYPILQWNSIPFSPTTQSSNVPIETTSPTYEVTTNLLVRDDPVTEVPSVTTPIFQHNIDDYNLEPVTSGTTQQYTTKQYKPIFRSVLVDSYEIEPVTYSPQISSSTDRDFEFLNLTESSFDTVTTTTNAPITSRTYPLKMFSFPTEKSMDFGSFNEDGIFDQDGLDPAVALSERVSVSLETTTMETVPQVGEENEVKDVPFHPPSMNSVHQYPVRISFVSSLVMFLPTLFSLIERRI